MRALSVSRCDTARCEGVGRRAVKNRPPPDRKALMAPNGLLHAESVVALADSGCGYICTASLLMEANGFTTIELKSGKSARKSAKGCPPSTLQARRIACDPGHCARMPQTLITSQLASENAVAQARTFARRTREGGAGRTSAGVNAHRARRNGCGQSSLTTACQPVWRHALTRNWSAD